MNGELPDLFTQPRRIGILRTSPYGHSRKFAGKVNHMIHRCVQIGVCVVWRGSPTKGGRDR
jgi:hypothetical protein